MRAVDTNVLVRLLTRDDPRQVATAEAFVADGAWVSQLVLASVYDLKPTAIAMAVEMLLNHKDLVLQDSDVASAALEHFRRHPRLGFSDCLVLETARKAGHLPLGTFDHKLGRIEGTQKL